MKNSHLLLSLVSLVLLSFSTSESKEDYNAIGVKSVSKPVPDVYLISIAINDYPQISNWLPLKNAERDATDLAVKLERDFIEKRYKSNSALYGITKDSVINEKLDSIVIGGKKVQRLIRKEFLYGPSNRDSHNLVVTSYFDQESDRFIPRSTVVLPKFEKVVLTGESARKENIYSELNKIASEASPRDQFVFYFGSHSRQDEDGQTYIFSYDSPGSMDNIDESWKEGNVISVNEIAKIFQKIKCKKQLYITEAGEGEFFAKNLLQGLFETNPMNIELETRDRTLISTRGQGYDASKCDPSHGPLMSYLLKSSNILEFFESKPAFYSQVYNSKSSCEEDNQDYMAIYHESDYRLFYSLLETKKKMRGSGAVTSNQTPSSDSGESMKYALVVGTNKYEYLTPLVNPKNDAVAVEGLLKTKFGFETTLLIDKSTDEFRQALLDIRNKMDSNDLFLFFIAGHGHWDDLTETASLAFKDSQTEDLDRYQKTYYSMADIESKFDAFPSNNIFVILDVCFGGTFDLNGKTVPATLHKDLGSLGLEDYVTRQNEDKARIFLASGRYEVPDYWETGEKHSPFAEKIISSMKREKEFLCPGRLFDASRGNVTKPILKDFGSHETNADFMVPVIGSD